MRFLNVTRFITATSHLGAFKSRQFLQLQSAARGRNACARRGPISYSDHAQGLSTCDSARPDSQPEPGAAARARARAGALRQIYFRPNIFQEKLNFSGLSLQYVSVILFLAEFICPFFHFPFFAFSLTSVAL